MLINFNRIAKAEFKSAFFETKFLKDFCLPNWCEADPLN